MGPSIQDGLTVVADNRQMRVYFSMTEKTVMQYLSEHQSMEATIQQMPELRLQLPSGGTGKIVIPTELHNAIVIPQEATYSIQDKVYVMKVVDGKAVASIVQVSPQNNGKEYVVISGLQEGDVIIAKGAGFVEEGTVIVKP